MEILDQGDVMHELSTRFPTDYRERALCQRGAGWKKKKKKTDLKF